MYVTVLGRTVRTVAALSLAILLLNGCAAIDATLNPPVPEAPAQEVPGREAAGLQSGKPEKSGRTNDWLTYNMSHGITMRLPRQPGLTICRSATTCAGKTNRVFDLRTSQFKTTVFVTEGVSCRIGKMTPTAYLREGIRNWSRQVGARSKMHPTKLLRLPGMLSYSLHSARPGVATLGWEVLAADIDLLIQVDGPSADVRRMDRWITRLASGVSIPGKLRVPRDPTAAPC